MNARLDIFFLLQRMIGSRAGQWYDTFLEMERWPAGRLQEWREQRLSGLLGHAAAHVSFYRDRGLEPDTSLAGFPVIDKELLHEHYLDLMTPEFRAGYEAGRQPRTYGWLEVTSGGTTGIPTTVIHDRDFRDMDRAARLFNQHVAGFPFGTPHYKLWGSVQDLHRLKESRTQRLMGWLAREELLNAFQMDDRHIEAFIRRMREHPRAYLLAYVDALEQVARHAMRHGLELPSFTSIITTGGSLTESTEAFLRETFHARIHNQYGSRDCGALACSCEAGLLHIHAPNVYVEVVDDHDRPVPRGTPGRVLVTFLGNRVFPIIRFDIGDIAVAGPETCSCGRAFPTLERVMARKSDLILSASGGYISPVFIRHVIGVEHGRRHFRRYQMIQHSRTGYELLIQPESGETEETLRGVLQALRGDLLEALGRDAELHIRLVEFIPESASGKYRYIVNNYRPAT